jgi:hypothetical protein
MLLLLVLAALALAVVSRSYRTYGLVVVGLALAAIAAVIVLTGQNESSAPALAGAPAQRTKRVDFERSHVEKLDKQDPDARNRIAVSEIRFDQIIPSPDSQPGTFESVRARLYNDSTHFALTDYGYYLAVQDCVAKVCTTIYDQRGLESATVPSTQARDVKIEIRAGEAGGTPPFKVLGTSKIILVPSETRAYEVSP